MDDPNSAEIRKMWHGTYSAYVIGLILSVVLTLASYFLVVKHLFGGWILGVALMVLALVQAAAQLLFFLHLGKESRPHWNVLVFVFMVTVLLIVVLGSIWIMFDLDERMMPGMH